jgi:hypothetical protein
MRKQIGKFVIEIRDGEYYEKIEERRYWQFSISLGSDKTVHFGFLINFFKFGFAGWFNAGRGSH